MTEFLLLAAPAPAAENGWGGVLALLLTAGVFWGLVTVHRRWREEKANGGPVDHSPALPSAEPSNGLNPQVSGPVDPFEPAGEPVSAEVGRSRDCEVELVPSRTPPGTPTAQPAELDRFVAARLRTQRPTEIISEAHRRFGRSRATVNRAIKRVRAGAGREVA
jgi:hypothetical protein